MNPAPSSRRSKLDLAIVASIAAMATMNLFVLAQQLPPVSAIATTASTEAPQA